MGIGSLSLHERSATLERSAMRTPERPPAHWARQAREAPRRGASDHDRMVRRRDFAIRQNEVGCPIEIAIIKLRILRKERCMSQQDIT
jgi:hypothetical protein